MVETRASKRARELGRPQEERLLVVVTRLVNQPSQICSGLVIQCTEPIHADCSGLYTKTYYWRSLKSSDGTIGKAQIISYHFILFVLYNVADDDSCKIDVQRDVES